MHKQLGKTLGWSVFASVVFAVAPQTAIGSDYLQVAQSTEEIIKALELPPGSESVDGLRKKGKTRGLSVEAAPAEAPSMDFRVEFEFGSATLTPEAMTILDNVGAALTSDRLSPYRFSIVGHTDAVGTEAYNMDLSQQRADAVRNYLMHRFGISGERLETYGLGENDLLDPTQPESGINRRVEVTNLGK
jgi:outer membrane protein OmpA-like peptidoglycan-associated protein